MCFYDRQLKMGGACGGWGGTCGGGWSMWVWVEHIRVGGACGGGVEALG